ncbi:unnamed protein product [Paramecium pentaurelia]|uniref:Uncharacterized protein n=1 Tax=Paramecium pentaurelia TaxID=43138 RepID=A0A8S1YR15_9CILI|nr:unnamed protein product [Paramecium pentaurelia]
MKIPCYKHEGQQILFIRFDKNKTEYVCDECFIGLESSTLQDLIHIKNALKSPEYFLSKLNLSSEVKEYLTDLDKQNDKQMNGVLIDLKYQITKIQKQLEDVYEEIEQNLNNFLDMKQKIKDQLKKITKFDQFTQLIMDLEKLGDTINPQAIEQSEKLLQQYLQDLTQKDSEELNSNLISMLKEIQIQQGDPNEQKQQQQQQHKENYSKYKELDLLNQQFKQSQIKFGNQITMINFNNLKKLKEILPTKLLSNYQRQKIIYTIQSKLDKIVHKCYDKFLSARDGLNIKAFGII